MIVSKFSASQAQYNAQDNSRRVASAHDISFFLSFFLDMHLRGCSKHVALRGCFIFIQQLIPDGNINAKQCPTAVQIADIGSFASSTFWILTEQLLGDKHVGGQSSVLFLCPCICSSIQVSSFGLDGLCALCSYRYVVNL